MGIQRRDTERTGLAGLSDCWYEDKEGGEISYDSSVFKLIPVEELPPF